MADRIAACVAIRRWRGALNGIAMLIVVLAASMCAPAVALAQQASPLAPLDTSSPRATYESFWQEARALERSYVLYRAAKTEAGATRLIRSLVRLLRLLDLSEVPLATQSEIGGAAAVNLFDVLLRLPKIPAGAIPDATGNEPVTKWRIPDTEIVIHRVAEGERSGEYLFSPATVARAEEFQRLIIATPPVNETVYENWRREQVRFTGPWFSYGLLTSIPPELEIIVFGTPLWKFTLVIILYLGAFGLVIAWSVALRHFTRNAADTKSLLLRLTTPVLLWILINALDGVVRVQINPSGVFAEASHLMVTATLFFALAWAAWLACFLFVAAIIATPIIPDDSYDAHLLRLLARVVSLLIAGGILIYGANDVGIPALGLLAGVGVGGFALALAAQSTVENLFGGVSIFADRPFRVGDFIRYGGELGVVEAIGPRSSRLRGLDNTLTTVPNADLARMHVTNFSKRTKVLFRHQIGLRYETSAAQISWFAEKLLERLQEHPMVEQASGLPRVRVIGFGASSIDLEVRAYVLTSDYGEFLQIQDGLMVAVMECIEAAGTGFAFPSQTAYIARDRGLDEARKRRIERAPKAAFAQPPDGSERTDLPEEEHFGEEASDTR